MKAAIYSRKSKFTGKGDSIENQVQMCKEHAKNILNCVEEDFIIYEDEGFSGGNTDRPRYQKMLRDAQKGKFDIIVCYRLDRISRNVSDFSQLIERLEKWEVGFISVKEQFDTTKPMGRAMMYIASVFSQLERETIAERIKDNMLQLSKTGRWLGGITPTGYRSEMVCTHESGGKELKSYKLTVVPEEAKIVRLIYDKYLSLRSITKVEKYLTQNRINTKNGAAFRRFSIRFILSNPVYAVADKRLYEYLCSNNYEIYSERVDFNGVNGLMGYNKTKQSSSSSIEKFRPNEEWILAVGLHQGIVSAEAWIEAQELLIRNKSKAYRQVRSNAALLSGIIRCGGCGSYMRPKAGRRNTSGGTAYYYICELKEKSGRTQCQMANANGYLVDNMLLCELRRMFQNYPLILNDAALMEVKNWFSNDTAGDELHLLEEKLFNTEFEIKNLIKILSREESSAIQGEIIKQVKSLNEQKEAHINSIQNILMSRNKEFNVAESAETFASRLFPPEQLDWEVVNLEAKRRFVKGIIKYIEWDGQELRLRLNS